MKFFAWLGVTIAAGIIWFVGTMGVLLMMEVGAHRRASFVWTSAHHYAQVYWIIAPIILTIITSVFAAVVISSEM